MNEQAQPAPVQVGAVHYQILCGAGLVLVFFAQLEQGMMLGNILVMCIGVLGIITGIRNGPALTLCTLFAAQIGNHLLLYRNFAIPQQRPWLHLGDLLLAIGSLAYVVGHYRLQSVWRHVLPIDPRQRRRMDSPRGTAPSYEQALQPRAERLLTPQEIARFVLGLPLLALAGQFVWLGLSRPWLPEVLPDRLLRLIVVAWTLVIGLLIVSWLLNVWKRRQMSQEAAQLYLQDTLWRETRREQRRIFRWLAWRKVRGIERDA
jgi:hypothetical protein